MSRYKQYIDTDVVTESLRRMRHVYDLFDTIVVCFSGGKDSLVCLHLARMVAEERGIDHVNVIFRDEELIPDTVINFVDSYRQQPWVRMKWFCIPLESEKFILGKRVSYVQWDRDRAWVRPKPDHAIVQAESEYRVLNQYNCDDYCAQGYKGSVAFVTGVRAPESLVRYRSVVNKMNENYICKAVGAKSTRIRLAKPIYDWSENDVFKWLFENDIRWSTLYDSQHLSGSNLRVSTPLHAESAKRLHLWRKQDPDFYQRVIDVFPEMSVQDRYWSEYDTKSLLEQYSDGLAGCRRYIRERIEDPAQLKMAKERLAEFVVFQRRNPEAYPAELLLKALVSGTLKRTIVPLNQQQQEANRVKRMQAG